MNADMPRVIPYEFMEDRLYYMASVSVLPGNLEIVALSEMTLRQISSCGSFAGSSVESAKRLCLN